MSKRPPGNWPPIVMSGYAALDYTIGVAAPAAPTPIGTPGYVAPAQAVAVESVGSGAGAAPPSAPQTYGSAPVGVVGPAAIAVSVAPAPTTTTLGNAPVPPTTSFSPNLETFASIGEPYFLTAGSGAGQVAQWATYPAVANVDMSGNSILNGNQVVLAQGGSTASFTLSPGEARLLLDTSGLHITPSTVSSDLPVQAPSFSLPLAGLQSGPVLFTDTSGTHDLRSIDGNLYFDTELLAKANDIQDVADWALYPALAAVDMDGQVLVNAEHVGIDTSGGAPIILSSDASANLLKDGQKVALVSDVSASVAQWSSFPALTAVDLSGHDISGCTGLTLTTAGQAVLTSDVSGNLLVNGSAVSTGTGGNVSQWATFPAVANVAMGTYNIDMCGGTVALTSGTLGATLINNSEKTYTRLLETGSTATIGGSVQQTYGPATSNNFFGNPVVIGEQSPVYTGGLTVYGPATLDGGSLHGTSIGCLPVPPLNINSVRIDALPVGTIDIVCPAAMTLDAGGAGNFACGGALSLAGGGYIEMNTGETRMINTTSNQSLLYVNDISANTYNGGNGQLRLFGVSQINGAAYPPAPSNWSQYPAIQTVDMSGNDISGAGNVMMASLSSPGGTVAVSTNLDFQNNPALYIIGLEEIDTVKTYADFIGSTFATAITLQTDISSSPGVGITADSFNAVSYVGTPNISMPSLTPTITATDVSPIFLTLRATQGVSVENTALNPGYLKSSTHSVYDTTAPTLFGDLAWNDASGRFLAIPNGVGASAEDIAYLSDIAAATTVYQATYYKTTVQNLTSGNTDITFDATGTWNNTGGFITHVNGTTDFTVVQTGLYQLEFNATVLANGATWTATSNKNVAIEITRSPTAEQTILINSSLTASGQNYAQAVAATTYLVAGDVINLRIGNTFAGGPAQAQCIQNTFDLNTFFTWTYISAGGATAYQNPPPVIQAAGTNALTPTNANTLYILTSGTTQNFTTAGLGAGNAGLVWSVKNAQPSGGGGNDVAVQHNGVAITGATSVLHQRTNTTNTGPQTLYWSGTDLIMY